MRRAALPLIVLGVAVSIAGAAQAQGKDPFRPPPAAGSPAGEGPDLGAPPGAPRGMLPDDRLARTGQNLDALVGLGMVFVLLGGGLRLTVRAAAFSGRGDWNARSRPRGPSSRPIRLKNTLL